MMTARVTTTHLQKRACVYVRQSTAAQVHEHIESKQRQYGLADRAAALGWPSELVQIVDDDQGRSGASADARTGFGQIAHDVAHGKVGAIFALEVSRLARSSLDWQRLLSLCAVAQVLVVDEQSVFDPGQHDDKLLLDIKGAMSEQELHWLTLRLAGGRLNKARRGEAFVMPTTGYVWGGRGLELDPDESVRKAIAAVFERFTIEPTGRAVLRWVRQVGFQMPVRDRSSGELRWGELSSARLYDMLHNPTYAGVYVFGRRPFKQVLIDGEIRKVRLTLRERSQWPVAIEDAHPGYITWEVFVDNQDKLRDNRMSGPIAGAGAPQEGQALLSGLLLCGHCGRRMKPRYEKPDRATSRWNYVCYADDGQCWSVAGLAIDSAVEDLFLQTMVPSELELSLAVEQEAGQQAASLDQAWRSRLEQVRYQARLAERRYKAVDPDNRVVARTLENDWEERLREVVAAEQQYDETRQRQKVELSGEDRARIRELARDLPRVWRSPTTSMADRKAMMRLAIEVIGAQPVDVPKRATKLRVQWQGGVVTEVMVPRPGPGEYRKHSPEVIQRVRELAAAGLHDEDIATQLNAEAWRTGTGTAWQLDHIRTLRWRHRIERTAPHRPRLLPLPAQDALGRYSVPGAMAHLGVSEGTVHRWLRAGLLKSTRADMGSHRRAHWIEIDDETAKRLRAGTRRRPTRTQKPVESTTATGR